jgi:hypothetical protein
MQFARKWLDRSTKGLDATVAIAEAVPPQPDCRVAGIAGRGEEARSTSVDLILPS